MTLTEKEFVLDTLRRAGKSAAVNLQAESPSMTGTELCAAEEYIPDFQAAKAAKNMLERKAGQKDGFVCRSSAGRVVRLCKEAGVVLTGAGATYPYKKDPRDRNIRVAPTYPTVPELEQAVELLCISVQLAAVEKLLAA